MNIDWFLVTATAFVIIGFLILLYRVVKQSYWFGMMDFLSRFRISQEAELIASKNRLVDLIFCSSFLWIFTCMLERNFDLWSIAVNLVAVFIVNAISYFLGTFNLKELY